MAVTPHEARQFWQRRQSRCAWADAGSDGDDSHHEPEETGQTGQHAEIAALRDLVADLGARVERLEEEAVARAGLGAVNAQHAPKEVRSVAVQTGNMLVDEITPSPSPSAAEERADQAGEESNSAGSINVYVTASDPVHEFVESNVSMSEHMLQVAQPPAAADHEGIGLDVTLTPPFSQMEAEDDQSLVAEEAEPEQNREPPEAAQAWGAAHTSEDETSTSSEPTPPSDDEQETKEDGGRTSSLGSPACDVGRPEQLPASALKEQGQARALIGSQF